MELSTLQRLLEPMTEAEFLSQYWNRHWTCIRGAKGRFEELLPWRVLNSILTQHWLDEPRLRLYQDGQEIRTSSFISHKPHRKDPFVRIPQLDPEALTNHLRNGATLVLRDVDAMHSPITHLVERLERRLRVRASANAYVSWHTSHAFDLHWDDHDVFIVQVFGRKQWHLYGVTREHPLGTDWDPNGEKPTTPIWEGTLESGDVLYLPRGVWHAALPLDEPTMHLTIGFTTSTGIDLLEWLAGRLGEYAVFRADLPRLGTEQEKAEHLLTLRRAFDEVWSALKLDEYLEYCDYMARPRPHLSLPLSPLCQPVSDSDRVILRWNVPREVEPVASNGSSLVLRANGSEWEFALDAEEIINLLRDRKGHSVSDLCAASENRLSRTRLINFLNELVVQGLLTIESE